MVYDVSSGEPFANEIEQDNGKCCFAVENRGDMFDKKVILTEDVQRLASQMGTQLGRG